MVEGDGDGEGGGGVLFGEGVELAGEAAGPVGHAGGSVAGGGPAGGVACGEAQEEALDSLSGLGFAFGLCVPTRTTCAAFVVGCGWPCGANSPSAAAGWGGFAVGVGSAGSVVVGALVVLQAIGRVVALEVVGGAVVLLVVGGLVVL